MTETDQVNPIKKVVGRSIEGQEASWKNALSRKFIGYEINPELSDNIIHILSTEASTEDDQAVRKDLKSFISLFNDTVDKFPFSGKVLITPALKGSFSEKDPAIREGKLVQALLILLIMSAAHGLQATEAVGALAKEPQTLVPSVIEMAYFIFNAAVTIRQLELTSRIVQKLAHNSKELAELIFVDDEALVKLLVDHIEKGHMSMIKYIVAIKGRKKVRHEVDRAMESLNTVSPNGTYDAITDNFTQEKRDELLESLSNLAEDLDDEKSKNAIQLAKSMLDMSHLKNPYTLSQTLVMISLTLGGQMAFLFSSIAK